MHVQNRSDRSASRARIQAKSGRPPQSGSTALAPNVPGRAGCRQIRTALHETESRVDADRAERPKGQTTEAPSGSDVLRSRASRMGRIQAALEALHRVRSP